MQFRYRAYGLKVESTRPLPGLLAREDSTPPDLSIAFPVNDDGQTDEGAGGWSVRYRVGDAFVYAVRGEAIAQAYRLTYTDNGHTVEFVIEPGLQDASVSWTPGTPYQDVMALTRANLLAAVVRLRGVLCLHADVLAVDGRAVAVMGASGAGKSTTTAALSERGCAILSDDMAVLHASGDAFVAQPTVMQLRLWETGARSLQLEPDALSRVFARSDKRFLPLSASPGARHRFQPEPLPLIAIYLLQPREAECATPSIRGLSRQQALLALARNTTTNFVLTAARRASEFELLGRLAARVPVRAVRRPDRLETLPQIARAILDDAGALAA